MTRGLPGAAALTLVAAVVPLAAALGWGCGAPPAREEPAAPQEAAALPGTGDANAVTPAPAPADRPGMTLFFADGSGRLVAEARELPEPAPALGEPRLRATLEALLAGPRGKLQPVIPPASTLRAAYLGDDGTAFVDLDAAFARGLSAGTEDALLAVWSIANSLAVSVPEVRRVRFLIEGEEVSDLGGHIDLTRPVLPDLSLVAGAGGGADGAR